MRIIKQLAAQIKDEVRGAHEYAMDALEYKVSDPDLSRLYHELAKTEYDHANRLHEVVMRKVDEADSAGFDVPESMIDSWEEKHREIIIKMAEAKTFIDMYR